MSKEARNIIICCDGTGNQLNETYSNVIKLYTCLEKDDMHQLVFYDPGVGTLSDPNAVTPWSKFFSKLAGLGFGVGLRRNVMEAYTYLMTHYRDGDRIFMFGFSRGAYTARVLAALIHNVGLLDKGCDNLLPYAWQAFRKSTKPAHRPLAAKFKAIYSRDVKIHFMGVWDTVTSYGIFNRIKLPYTTNNSSIVNIRHAVAIDERRTYYRQNLFGADGKGQDILQVWFAGVHSDVGGSYPFDESGLSHLALEWMAGEADRFGLVINRGKLKAELQAGPSRPDFHAPVHRSLSSLWWILEFLPRTRRRWPLVYVPAGRRRNLYRNSMGQPLTPTLHASVVQKIQETNYHPSNVDLSKPHHVAQTQPLARSGAVNGTRDRFIAS